MTTTKILAELKNITKCYGTNKANNNVSFAIAEGTIHGLIGENGAGKSTTMKTLYGMVTPDSGSVIINGKEKKHWSPALAFQNGIGMVHQHFMLANEATVLDNLVLGVEKTNFLGFRNRKAEAEKLTALMKETNLIVPLHKKINELSVSEKSRCEILKVLYRNAKLLILDEPTAVLTPQETEDFLETLKNLRKKGITILIVTHKLKEVFAICDTVTVMRQGQVIDTKSISELNEALAAELMIGRPFKAPKRVTSNAASKNAAPFSISDFQIDIAPGEIVGIAGIEGNGQEELTTAVIGDPKKMRKDAFGFVSADRHHDGMILDFSLQENLYLGRTQAAWSPTKHLPGDTQSDETFLKQNDVRPHTAHTLAKNLSGGNQQKLIVARELDYCTPLPKNLFIMNPTRGVDIGAIEHIHKKLLSKADEGCAVLLVSTELEELMNLSDRIGVLYKGKIASWHKPPFDEKKIGYSMLTGSAES